MRSGAEDLQLAAPARPEPPRPPGARRSPTIRSRFVLCALATALPLLLLAGVAVWQQHRAERARVEETLVAQAHAVALLLDSEFAAAEGVLRMLGRSRSLAQGEFTAFSTEVRGAAATVGARAINLIRADGVILDSSARLQGEQGRIVRTGPAIQALATGRTTIGNLYFSPVVEDWAVGIALPILQPPADGTAAPRVSHVLGYIMSRDRMLAALTRQRLHPGATAMVADRRLTVVAAAPQGAWSPSASLPAALLGAMTGEAGLIPSQPLAPGQPPVVTAFARAPDSGYWVSISVPEAVFEEPLRAALWQTLLIGTALLGASLLTGILLGGSFAASLRRLAAPGAQYAGASPARTDLREVGELADALARHAAERERAVAELRALFHASPVGVARTDAGGRVQDANDAFLGMVGMTRADLIAGRVRWDDLTPPEWIGRDEAAIAEAASLGACAPYQKEYVRPDGTRVPVLTFFAFHDRAAGGAAAFVVDLSRWGATEAALSRAHGQMRMAIGTARMLFWDWDILTGKVECSEGLEAAYRMPPGSMGNTAEALRLLIHPEDRSRVDVAVGRALSGEEDFDTEFRALRADGSVRWVVARGTVLRDGMGRPVRMIGIDFDVTDRKAAELALARSEASMRRITEAARVATFEMEDPAGDEEPRVSTGFRELHGLPPEGRCDFRAIFRHLHPEDRGIVHAEHNRLGGKDGRFTAEYRVILPDGRVRWLQASGEREPGQEGRPVRLRGIILDITERKEAELALRESEAGFRALVEAMPQLSFVARPDGHNEFNNQGWCEYTGQSPEQAAGEGWAAALHPEDRDRTAVAWEAARSSGAVYEIEHRLRGTDGTYRWFLTRAAPLRAANDAIIRWFGTCTDISDIVAAREAAADAAQELERRVAERTRALSDAARELQAEMRRRQEAQNSLLQSQKLEALGQLTSGVAHDFNNILAAIQGGYQMLERQVEAPRARELVRQGLHAAERGARLIAQLMSFARREELQPALTDLGELLREAEDMVCHTAGRQLRCEYALAPDVWPVIVDPVRLETVLLNLAANARDAMPEGGTLTILARNAKPEELPESLPRGGDHVLVSVADTGCGMDAETLRRATEPFFTTKPSGKGTGLGLASAHAFAAQSGGALRLRSAPGEGTTVELFLPRAGVMPATGAAPDGAALLDRGRHEAATILVVDDDEGVRPVTAGLLRELGCRVIEAPSAEAAEALAHAEGGRLDMLVTDVVMGGAAGPVLAARLRAERPDLPVLYITGQADVLPGDAPVLRKPFTDAALAGAVLKGLGRSGEPCRATPELAPPERPRERLDRPELREAYRHWLAGHGRGAGGMPPPAAFVPEELSEGVRDHAFLAEVLDGGKHGFRFLRLGPALEERLGHHLADEVLAGSACHRCTESGTAFHGHARFAPGDGRLLLLERLILPLSADGTTVTHLGGIALFTELPPERETTG